MKSINIEILMGHSIGISDSYYRISGTIWEFIKMNVEYKEIPYKPQSVDTVEFGILSQKTITQTLEDIFQARPPKHKGSSRSLIFSQNILDRMHDIYDIDADVEILENDNDLGAHGAHFGLDRHMSMDNDKDDDNNNQIAEEVIKAANTKTEDNNPISPRNAPQVTQVPQYTATATRYMHEGMYFSSGKNHCPNCGLKGDRFYMESQECNNNKY